MRDPIEIMDTELQQKIAQARADGKQVLIIDNDTLVKDHPIAKTLADGLYIDPSKVVSRYTTFDDVYQANYAEVKVDPREFFISCGPGKVEDRYYGMVMRPATDEEVESRGEWIVVAIEDGWGHVNDFEAKTKASQRYPTLPVLMGADTYVYPCWKSYDRKLRILKAAADRRAKRGLIHIPNHFTKLDKGSGERRIGPKHKRRRK